MFHTLRNFLIPPVFQDDPEKTRIARSAYLLLELVWLFLLFVIPVFIITAQSPAQALSTLFIDGSLFILIPVLLTMLRRGQVRLVSLLFSLFIFLTGAYFSFFFQDSLLEATVTFIAVVIIGAQFMGEKGVWIMGGLGLLSQFGKITAAAWGWHMAVIPTEELLNDATFSIFQFLFFCFMLGLSMRSLAAALNRSRMHEQQALEKNQALLAEIAERKQAEIALRENEAQLALVFNSVSDMQVLLRIESGDKFITQAANKSYLDNLPNSFIGMPQEIIGKAPAEIMREYGLPTETIEKEMSRYREALEKQRVVTYETQFPRSDTVLTFDVSLIPVLNQNGECTHVLWSGRNITERKKSEAALRLSEERYRCLAQNLPNSALILYDQDLRFMVADGPELEATGFSREMLEGKTLYEALPAEFVQMVEPNMHRALSGEMFYAELPYDDRFYRYSYVPLRDHSGEVSTAMILAHNITERKQIEDELKESRNFLQTILDTIPARIFWKDLALNYLGCNQPFALDGGASSPEELIGKDDYQMGWREQADLYRNDDFQVMRSGVPKLNYEEPQTTPDGQRIWLRTSKVPLLDPNGGIRGILGTYEDITERKLTEEALQESEEKFRTIVENALAGIFTVGNDYCFVYANDELSKILGYSIDELIGLDFRKILSGDSRDLVADRYIRRRRGEEVPNRYELTIFRKDGGIRNVEMTVTLVTDKAGNLKTMGQLIDITERKKTEEALRQSEERLQQAIRVANIGLFDHDHLTDTMFISSEFQNIFGWENMQTVSFPILAERIYPEDMERVGEALQRAHAPEDSGFYSLEHRIFGRDDVVRWISIRSQSYFEGEGETRHLVRTIGAVLDITESRKTQEALRESEFVLRRSQSVAQIGSYYLDARTGIWLSSPALNDILGIDESYTQDVEGWITLVHPDEQEELRHYFMNYVIAGKNRFEKEYRIVRHNDHQERWIFGLGELEFDANGLPIKMIGTLQDITERKLAESALQQAGLIVENSPVMLFRWRAVAGWPVVLVSENIRQLGYSAEEFLNGAIKFAEIIYPDDLDRVIHEVQAYTAEGLERFQQEYRIIAKDGRVRWLDDQTAVEKNAAGEITHFQGIVVDITERKQVQDALRISQERLQQAIAVGNVGIFEHDHISNVMYSSEEMKAKYGLAMNDEVSMREFQQRLHPDDVEKIGKALMQANDPTGDGIYNVEYRFTDPKGTLRWLLARAQTFFEGDGINKHPVRTVGALIDITERKQMEETLRQSQQMLRNVLNQFPGVVFWKDRQSVYLGCNQAFSTAAGLANPFEIVGKTDFDLPWKDSEAKTFRADDRVVINSGQPRFGIIEPQHQADGRIAWFDTAKVPLLDDKGNVLGVLGASRDITEQKQAEQALRESEEKYRNFVETVPDGFYRSTPQGKFVALNEAMVKILGYDSKEELMAVDIATTIYPRPEIRVLKTHKDSDATPASEIYQLKKKDGTFVWIEDHCRYLKDKDGNVLFHEGVCRDITERKQAEEKIAISLQEKDILLKEIHHRVKNNLQVISSLLYLQSQKIQDESLLELFRESQNRVASMALIHEQLYQSDNFARADFGTYVRSLLATLFESYGAAERQVTYNLNTFGITLAVNIAVPCGLLVNEIVSNALKHAFPSGRGGQIDIELKIVEQEYQLEIRDNGIGMPEPSQIRTGSLGMRLIRQLVMQLGGTMERIGPPGTCYRIHFSI